MNKLSTVVVIIVVGVLIVASQAFYKVDQIESAIVIQLGKPVRAITEPGLYVKTPFAQKVVYFDNRLLIYDATPSAIITKDKKNLVVDNYAKWRIVDPLKYFQTVRNETGAQSRLDDVIFSNLREELGKHDLFDIVAKTRASLMETVTEKTNEAVFARMMAERQREAKRYRSEGEEKALAIRASADKDKTVILSEAGRKSQILKGEGDAVATRLYAGAYSRDPKFFEFINTMEAYKKTFGERDTLIVTPASEFFKYIQKSR